MPGRYLSDALQGLPGIAPHTEQIQGVEASIYNRIWRLVVEGALKPGAELQESEIAGIFGISLSVAHKVISVMEREGIVELPPNRNPCVANPSREDAREAIEAAQLIGVHVASQLAARNHRIDPQDVERIDQHIAMQAAAEATDDHVTIRTLMGEFHILLTYIYGNRYLMSQYELLLMRMMLASAFHQHDEGQLHAGADFQKGLLDHILAHDQQAAVQTMQTFYRNVADSLHGPDAEEQDLRSVLSKDRKK